MNNYTPNRAGRATKITFAETREGRGGTGDDGWVREGVAEGVIIFKSIDPCPHLSFFALLYPVLIDVRLTLWKSRLSSFTEETR